MKYGMIETFFATALLAGVVTMVSMASAVVYAVGIELSGDSDITELAAPKDSGQNASPAAGHSGQKTENRLSCKDFIYQTSYDGIKYVRESGGTMYNAVLVNNKLEIYTLDYGYLTRVDDAKLDQKNIRELEHALTNCHGPFVNSGVRFI
jgi:hypothetical protein